MQWTKTFSYAVIEDLYIFEEKKLEKYRSSGAYILRDKEENILYIGESENLSERIKEHLKGKNSALDFNKGYKHIYKVDLYIPAKISNIINRHYIEISLIDKFQPPFNSQYTPEHGDKDKMEEKRQKRYFNTVKSQYTSREKWSGYEKLAYFERLSLIDTVLMVAEGISKKREETNAHPLASTQEWYSTLKTKYINELMNEYNYTIDQINQIALEIGRDPSYPDLKPLLPKRMRLAGDTHIRNNYGSGFKLPLETKNNKDQRRSKGWGLTVEH